MSLKLDNAIKAHHRTRVYLVQLDHVTGSIRLNSGFRDLDADVGEGLKTFKGAGSILNMELPGQSPAIEVSRFSISLSGLSENYAHIANEKVRGSPINIWVAFLNHKGRVVVYELLESGLADRVGKSAEEDGSLTLTLTCIGNFSFLASQSIDRWTAEHQKLFLTKQGVDASSDTGFDTQHGIPQQNDGWFRP